MLTISNPPNAIYFKGSCCAQKIVQPKPTPTPPNSEPQPAEPPTTAQKADPPSSGILASLKQQVKQWVQEFWRILTTDFLALFQGNPKKSETKSS